MTKKLTEEQVINVLEHLLENDNDNVFANDNVSKKHLLVIDSLHEYKNIFKYFLVNYYLREKDLLCLKKIESFLESMRTSELMDIFITTRSKDVANFILQKHSIKLLSSKNTKKIIQAYKDEQINFDKLNLLKNYTSDLAKQILNNKYFLNPMFLNPMILSVLNKEEIIIFSKKILKNWDDSWDVINCIYHLEYEALDRKSVLCCIDKVYKDKTYEISSLYKKINPILQEDEEISKKCEEKYFYLDVKKSAVKTFEDFAKNVNEKTLLPYAQWQELLNKAKSINLFKDPYNIIRFIELLVDKNIISDFDFQADPSFNSHPFLDFLKENEHIEFLNEFKQTEKGQELWNKSVTGYIGYSFVETKMLPEIISHLKAIYYKVEINKDLIETIKIDKVIKVTKI